MTSSLNRIFKVIWSKVQIAWVVVSEATTAHGKQQSITRITRTITTVVMLSGGAAIAAPPAPNQLPTGGQVAAGVAAIGTNGNTMTITQSSNRAAINWNTFDIGSQAAVNFVQPSSQAVALNRVNSPDPSQIYGSLSSNGQVYLINAAGIYFAPGAQVNVGGIVATTHQMSDAAFMAGSTTFDRNGSTGKVINEGTIQTSLNGYIAMLAPEVRNSGLLLAQSGTVALAAGERITLNFGPTSKLESITVTEAQLDTLVENRHAIKAPNGLVILSARAANQLAASVVNSGTIEAKGVSQQGGRILLEGSTVTNTGTLDVSSDTAQAGTIQINGKNVSISGNVIATTPAQNTQGGSVKVSATQSLNLTNANINVSASQGGQIQLSANQLSVSDSSLNADGDTGGSIRLTATSIQPDNPFHDPLSLPTLPATLAATGFTSISSRGRRGQGGNVTLTGDSITLDGNTNINVSGTTGGGKALIGGDWQGSNGTYQATTVYMGQNVVIDASATDTGNGGKVVLWSDITKANSWTNAYGRIYAKGGANGGDGGQIETSGHNVDTTGVIINAGSPFGQGGLWLIDPYDYTIDATAASSIVGTLNTGTSVTIDTSNNTGPGAGASGSGNISINSAINKTAGAAATLTFNAANWIAGSGAIGSASNALNVVFNVGASTGTYSGVISGTGSLTKEGAGTLTLTSANTNSGGTSVNAGTLQIGNGGTTGSLGSGNITVNNATLAFNYSSGTSVTVGSSSAASYITLNNATVNTLGGNVTLAGYASGSGNGTTPLIATNILGTTSLNASTGASLTLSGTTTNTYSHGIALQNGTALSSSGSVTLSATGTGGAGWNHLMGLYGTNSITAATGSTLTINVNQTVTDWALAQYGSTAKTNVSGNVTFNLSTAGSWDLIATYAWGNTSMYYGPAYTSTGGTLTFNLQGATTGGIHIGPGGPGTFSASATGAIIINAATTSGNTPTFVLAGAANTIYTGAGSLTINAPIETNGYALTWSGGSGAINIGGVISGTGALTFSTTGTSTLTGANTYTGATTISSGQLIIQNDAPSLTTSGFSGAGSLIVQSAGNTFTSAFDFNKASSGLSSLTIGKSTNTGAVTISAAQSIAGPITVYGGNISVNAGLTSTASGAAINLQGTGWINQAANVAVTTSNGDVTYISNFNNNTTSAAGGIVLNTGSSIATSGGAINLGSSSNYAIGAVTDTSGSTVYSGVLLSNSTLNAGAGAIGIYGKSTYTAGHNGIGVWFNFGAVSGGNITLIGYGSAANTNSVNYGVGLDGTTTLTASGNLSVTGTGGGTGVSNLANRGIETNGATLTTTGGGTITLTGTVGNGTVGANYNYALEINSSTLGGASQTGNVVLNGDSINFMASSATNTINTSGTVTIAPLGTSFYSALTYPMTNLTVDSRATGLTIGKTGNTADITIGSATSIAGPITVYGGNISLSAGLTTTNATTGNITLTGNVSGAGNISLANNRVLTITENGTSTYSGNISGTGARLVKAGTGALTLSGTESYTGLTNVSAGTLIVTGSLSDSSAVTVASGATYNVSATDTIGSLAGAGTVNVGSGFTLSEGADNSSTTFSGVITGLGGLTKVGTGTTTLTGINTYGGTTTISAGTLQIGDGTTSGAIANTSAIVDNGTLVFNQATGNTTTVALGISGTGNLTQNGSGSTVILTGANTYSGNTTIGAGSLVIGVGGSLGSSGSYAGNISNAGTFSYNASTTQTLTGVMSGAGNLVVNGSGTLGLSNANTYTGTTTITSGTLQLNSGGTINNSSSITDNGTLAYNNSAVNTAALVSGSGNISVGTISSSGTTLQLTAALGVSGALTVYSGNVLDLNGHSSPNAITISGTGISNGGALINSNATAGSQSGAVTLAGATSIGGSGNFTIGGVIGGAYALTKVGANTITLSGANTYSGGTTVSGGTLQAGASSGSGNSPFGTGDVTVNGVSSSNLATVDLNGKTISNNISMSNNASLVSNTTGSGVLTGALTLLADTDTGAAANGSLTLGTIIGNNHTFRFMGGTGSSYVQAGVASNLSAYTLFLPSSGNLTLNAAVTVNGTVQIQTGSHTGNIAINAALQATGSNGIWLDGNITQTAAITAGELYLNGNAVLTNTANNVSLLTADTIANLTYVNANAFTIGYSSNFGIHGVNATGSVNISTQTGNLTLTEAVSTTSTASNAVVLNAASTVAAGTATGGNILVSGNGTVSVGSGGSAVLYTGSIANSTGVTALVGSGSGNFRYNSNASSQGYSLALGAGVSAVYREQPSLTVTAANANVTYGTAPTLSASTNGVNGDTDAQIFGSNTPTLNVTSNTSTSGNYVAGNHTIVVSGGTNQLGYASPTYVNGTLAVAQKTLTVTGTTVADKVYDGNDSAAVSNGTLSGKVVSDEVNLTQSGNFIQANVGSNLAITTTDSINGADAANYVLTQPTGFTANITKRTVTLSDTQVYSGSATLTNVAIGNLVGTETLTYSGATANSSQVGDNATNYVTGISLANGTNGGLASNYQLPTLNHTNAPVMIDAAPLGIAVSATYNGGNTFANQANGTNYQLMGLVNGETITTANLTIANGNVASSNNYVTGLTVVSGNASLSNYVLSGGYNATAGNTQNTVTLTAAPLTITAQAANMTYSGTGYTGGNVSYNGFVGNDGVGNMTGTIAYGGNSQGATNAGSYVITPSGQSNSNYVITYANGTLTINPAPLGVVATGVYNGTTTLVPNSYSVTGLVNGETLTSLSAVTVSNANVAANTYVTAISSGGGTANLNNYQITQAYNASPNTTTTNAFTMAKANLTITADNAASFIGLGLPTSYNVSYTGFVNGQTASTAGLTTGLVANSATGTSGAGTYTLTPSGFSANNYSISYTNGTYTVVPADTLLVQAGSHSTAYATSASLTPTSVQYYVNGTGVVNLTYVSNSGNTYTYNDGHGGSVTFTLSPTNATTSSSGNLNAGSYQVGGSNLSQGGNINLNGSGVYTGSLSVSQQAVTASTSNVSKVYDGTTAMTGMNIGLSPVVSGDILTANGNGAFGQANVGTNISYNVTGLTLGGTDAGNYYLTGGTSFFGSNGVITATPLTISANNVTKTYGATANLGNANFTSTGLVSGQTIGSVTLSSSGSMNTANVGNYSIAIGNATGGTFTASNYNITYGNGTLTVNPAPLGISAAGLENGTTTITPTSYTLTGLQNNETLTVGSVTVASASPGMANNYVLALNDVTGSALLSNYYLNSVYNGTLGTNMTNVFAMTAKPAPAPSPASGINYSVFQQIALQGGTMVYIPLPKTQVRESQGSHKAMAFSGSVEIVADQSPENSTEPGFMSQPEAGFTDRFFGYAPRIKPLPEVAATRLVQQDGRILIVGNDGQQVMPVAEDERFNLPHSDLQESNTMRMRES